MVKTKKKDESKTCHANFLIKKDIHKEFKIMSVKKNVPVMELYGRAATEFLAREKEKETQEQQDSSLSMMA